MHRVLVTGGTGFVGTPVLRRLAAMPVQVRLVLRPGSALASSFPANVEGVVETPDLFAETPEWYESACAGIDTVLHLAWYVEPGKYLTSEKNLDCLAGSLNLARAAAGAGVKKFVGTGTCFEYDTREGYLSTATPLSPDSLYAASKASLYGLLRHYLPANDVDFVWCRVFFLYGEGEKENRLVPYIRSRIASGLQADLTEGRQIRDYLDVNDAASQILDACLHSSQTAVNICSGKPVTVRQLAEQIADEFGRRDLLNFGARENNFTDPDCVVGVR
jgi:nucleoside-diphosphate-sugar epimerase